MNESKIDWDSAPEWADRLMQAKSGKLFWCNVEKYLYSLDRPSGTPVIFGCRHSAYTIGEFELTEMRPVEDKVDWDGKGKPPIGCECEFNYGVTHERNHWQKVKIVAITNRFFVYVSESGVEEVDQIGSVTFRPPKNLRRKRARGFYS